MASKDDEPKRVGIRVRGKGHKLRSLKSSGYEGSVEIEGEKHDVEDVSATLPSTKPTPKMPKPSFWHHPLAKTALYIAGVVVAAWLVWLFGFKQ